MRNLRKVEKNYYLSGGWQDIFLDVERLRVNKIVAVLDLQYTLIDEIDDTIKDTMEREGINYKQVRMYDGEYNQNLSGILDETEEWLAVQELKISPKENILVKCGAGVSRSAAVLINHLCIAKRLTYFEALNLVRNNEEHGRWLSGFEWPVSLDPSFQYELNKRYPEYDSAFGEKE